MSRYVFEENTTVWWVPTIANPAAPTAAEINAGTNLIRLTSTTANGGPNLDRITVG